MFLDPEPRNSHRRQSQSEFQGFIPPLASPIDQRMIRKPLGDRSPNQPITKVFEDEDTKPTVRLVRATPSVASIRKEVFGEPGDKARKEKWKPARSPDLKLELEKDLLASDLQTPQNEVHDVELSIDDSLNSAVSEDLPPWKRRSISSSNFSQATTLKGSENAGSAYAGSQRLSSGTTVRELSTLHDTSLEDLPESAEEAGPLDDTDCSITTYEYEESIAEQQTIKPVLASIKSYESEIPQAETPRPRSRRATWLSELEHISSSPPVERSYGPAIPPRISSKHASVGSFSLIQSAASTPKASPSQASSSSFPLIRAADATPQTTSSTPEVWSASPAQSEASNPTFQDFASSPNFAAYPSSPNFIAYDTSPTRPRSRSHPLRGEPSYESISSRLQGEQTQRRSLAPSASWSSVDPASSHDTLPSLHVPRRRLRMIKGSHSLDLNRQVQESTHPYSRNGFSGNLSTIASESERSRSRTASQQLSHFSLGSGNTADNTLGLSADWTHQRLGSVPVATAGDDEPGDMTLGLYREESAMPEPLFRAPSPPYQVFNKKYDGPLPPLPPMPSLHDEDHDTLAELNPGLKLKRSGYSLRHQRSGTSLRHSTSGSSLRHQRSNSTPVHSRQISITSCSESDRWSTGTSIFPTWAKAFYSGNVAIASMSHISLYSVASPPTREGAQNGTRFERFPSKRYQRSIASPPTTAMSDAEFETPQGKFTIPAIFRPRNRPLRITEADEHGVPRPQVRHVQSTETMDSMAIEPVPLSELVAQARLPSGRPVYGELKDDSEHRPKVPRKYSKQKQWDEMDYPRPMTQDEMAGLNIPMPHLAPTKRSSAHIDAWRPPSFVESIDLIFKSRGHRQILFFLVGFICPFVWMIGAFMPLPPRPGNGSDPEKGSVLDDNLDAAIQQHAAGEAAERWREEKAWRQGLWWRNVNRVMSVVGLFIIGAVIAIAVVATR
ncbi:hypothetical protein AMS68_007568 [Peltaster fructicola]|uniref:Serine-rich protein n=1 Tax=Peltaster fructicola TaxID=286661 RepID=A0A6H0Y556_9PEZI|nr:hypothetical protein AMS68_007568 [Peltaster fructicola]